MVRQDDGSAGSFPGLTIQVTRARFYKEGCDGRGELR